MGRKTTGFCYLLPTVKSRQGFSPLALLVSWARRGAVLWMVGCLVASLAASHYVSPPQLCQTKLSADVTITNTPEERGWGEVVPIENHRDFHLL